MAILGMKLLLQRHLSSSTKKQWLSRGRQSLLLSFSSTLLYTTIGLIAIFLAIPDYSHGARIKEIATFEGVRSNHLIGYGLIVGLDGTGDNSGTDFTIKSLSNMLNRFGVKVDASSVKVKNVAAVVVTANLSPFTMSGSDIDVVVSSIGDAKSLQGGTLLFTTLKGADQQVYAVAQGSVSIGGFSGGSEGTSVQKNHLTVGRIPGGGLVERSIPLSFGAEINLLLRRVDFTTASMVAKSINGNFDGDVAHAVDGTRVAISVPGNYAGRVVDFLATVESLDVGVDNISKVVVNERTGTIVIGENVRIATVAVSHGNLSVEIQTTHKISQPAPFGAGETVVQPEANVRISEDNARLLMLKEGVSLRDLVGALNALGVTPRDLIAVLQAIKAAGALQADLEII